MSGISIWQLLILALPFIVAIGLLPSIIAIARSHPHKLPIILVNILGGLVFGIGWLVALVWSLIVPGHASGSSAALETSSTTGQRR